MHWLLHTLAVGTNTGANPKVELGKALFFDTNLSANGSQSCATCHAQAVASPGLIRGEQGGVVYHGGYLPNHFGNRKPPTSAYAGDSPRFIGMSRGVVRRHVLGRPRRRQRLGDPLAEQAKGPFLNPLEMALADAGRAVYKVTGGEYAGQFEQVWGEGSLDCTNNVAGVYEKIAHSVAAYERSSEVNPFSSKFDQFWDKATRAKKDVTQIKVGSTSDPYRWQAYRQLGLSDSRAAGLASFNDPNRASCSSCHSLKPGPQGYPLFTDFGYDNSVCRRTRQTRSTQQLGTLMARLGWTAGLGGYLKDASQNGKFKVPTLRNVDRRPPAFVKAYGHNGYFKSLDDIVIFYHWRAMMDGGGMGGVAEWAVAAG